MVTKKREDFKGCIIAWFKYIGILAICIYLLSGFYLVKTFETGILRLFGSVVNDHISPGLHYRIPYPITKLDKIKLQERKRLSVGFEFSDQALGRIANPTQGEFISGDENIINIEMVIQYFIISPVEYLLKVDKPEPIIRSYIKKGLTKIVSQMEVDEILKGEGKVLIQSRVLAETQSDLDNMMAGKRWVQITSVNLQNVAPPLEVADAFKDVVTARQDRDRLINEAQGYRYDALPKARGRAEELIQLAEIYRQEKINTSKGNAERFLKMVKEFTQKSDITATRLYLETMEQVLKRIRKIFVQETDQQTIDLDIVDIEE